MKLNDFNFYLLNLAGFLFLVLLLLMVRHRGWERADWGISVLPQNQIIQVNVIEASSSKEHYHPYGAYYPQINDTKGVLIQHSDRPIRLLWQSSDRSVSLIYPDHIYIRWVNLKTYELREATLQISSTYWKGMKQPVNLNLAFEEDDEIVLFVSGNRDDKGKEVGRYPSTIADGKKWIDLVPDYLAEQLTPHQQIDLMIKEFRYKLEIIWPDEVDTEPEDGPVISFHGPKGDITLVKSDNPAGVVTRFPLIRTVRFTTKTHRYAIMPDPKELLLGLEEMNKAYPGEWTTLCLRFPSEDEVVTELKSPTGETIITIEQTISKYTR